MNFTKQTLTNVLSAIDVTVPKSYTKDKMVGVIKDVFCNDAHPPAPKAPKKKVVKKTAKSEPPAPKQKTPSPSPVVEKKPEHALSPKTTVMFYEPKDPYYEFSNFYKHKLNINGVEWSCVEHYFQAEKFHIPDSPRHMEYYNIIRLADSPTKIFMLGRQKKKGLNASKWVVNKKHDTRLVNDVIGMYQDLQPVSDWNTRKLGVMKTALMEKFTQNENLKKMLLGTGNAYIVENSPRDDYWGVGKDGNGKNMLGTLLMEVRSDIKK